MEKDKILYSPHRQYQINITKLIEISQLIDKDNKYSQEINNKFSELNNQVREYLNNLEVKEK